MKQMPGTTNGFPEFTDVALRLMSQYAQIRYVACESGGVVQMRQREGLADGTESSAESDRYEELFVNPTLLLLTARRGMIDCGGMRYVTVAYGNFTQLVSPIANGHISIAIDRSQAQTALFEQILNTVTDIRDNHHAYRIL